MFGNTGLLVWFSVVAQWTG